MEILIKAAQLILSLSILVIFHEFGHFIFAKLFKTRVEKFYLFFDPWFSLFKFKKGDTEYGIGWLPLGGYVKISGMIDESMDKEQMQQPPQPWEFRSKPAWQRLLIMVGGVLVNFLLAITIYILVLFHWGEQYLPAENLKYGIECDMTALEMGLQNGDVITRIDDKEVESFRSIRTILLLDETQTLTVKRDGREITLDVPQNLVAKIIERESFFVQPAFPFIVHDFVSGSKGKEAGLQEGDKLTGINDSTLQYFSQFPPVLADYSGQTVTLHLERNGREMTLESGVSSEGKLGVYPVPPTELFEFKQIEYGFFEAIPAGIAKGYKEVGDYLKQFKLIFSPETGAYKSLGGFIAIGNIFPPTWDWESFWIMTALLSIMLGVINILPIPALDGGHVMFLMYEIITGRKPSDKFMEYAQITGMILLLGLLIYANGNDIIKLLQ